MKNFYIALCSLMVMYAVHFSIGANYHTNFVTEVSAQEVVSTPSAEVVISPISESEAKEVVEPKVGLGEAFKGTLELIGTAKGKTAMALILIISQILTIWLNTGFFDKWIGHIKMIVIGALQVVVGVIGFKIAQPTLGWFEVITASGNLTLIQNYAYVLFKQWGKKK